MLLLLNKKKKIYSPLPGGVLRCLLQLSIAGCDKHFKAPKNGEIGQMDYRNQASLVISSNLEFGTPVMFHLVESKEI